MENLNPQLLQEFLDAKQPNSLPSVNILPQAFIDTITYGFIALNVLAALFLIVYIVSTIRKWKVQSAILDIQKDVRDIKRLTDEKINPTSAPRNK